MTSWVLIIWSFYTPAFVAGDYQTYDQCEAAGAVQSVGMRGSFPGKLHWVCKRQDRYNGLR